MRVFEIVIALLLGGAALAALARRFGAPYPALVALAGAGLALVPGLPTLVLDPELALALFVAPVLLDATLEALEAKGAPRVVLSTAERNESAQRLFARAGFRRTMIEMTRESGAKKQ